MSCAREKRRAERRLLGSSGAAKLAADIPQVYSQASARMSGVQLGNSGSGAAGAGAGIRTRTGLRPNACETFASTNSATPAPHHGGRDLGRLERQMTRHLTNVTVPRGQLGKSWGDLHSQMRAQLYGSLRVSMKARPSRDSLRTQHVFPLSRLGQGVRVSEAFAPSAQLRSSAS